MARIGRARHIYARIYQGGYEVVVGGDVFEPITAGAITWTGQSVTATVAAAISPGAITWTGQSVPGTVGTFAQMDPGLITWAGSTVTASIAASLTQGAITWTGQAVPGVVGTVVQIEPGIITWTGRAVTASIQAAITRGQITWTGQLVTPNIGIPVNAGAVTWAGRAVTVSYAVVITAGQMTWTGQTITIGGIDFGVPVPNPQAELTALHGSASLQDTRGEAVLVGVSGQADLEPRELLMLLKQGDTAPKATATLKNGTTPVDLTGATVLMRVKRAVSDLFVFSKTATITNPTGGAVEYQWITGDTTALTPGAYYIEWVVTFSGGLVQRFPQPSNNELVVRKAAPAA